MSTDLRETQISSERIMDGSILHVYRDQVRLPNGNPASRELIRHVGAVCVVPLTDDGKVILEQQFRYPVDCTITEIPAGKLNDKSEDPLAAAKRELQEETGIVADRWYDLGLFYPAAAYSDETIHMYLATGLHQGTQNLDADEFLDLKAVELETMVAEILAGKIPDLKTQAAILRAYLMRQRQMLTP